MAEELKPPVAIRITRPYETEAEFLEREFDTLTHTSVILLGAQARPQGVVLRFEIVLKTGESILRGEGRVVGYKEKAYAGEPGLSLRFTRLDSRSKTLVDRASGLREARVRASTSLMSMPAVVVPRPPPPASPPIAAAPPPSSPQDPGPRRASSVPPPPPSRRAAPPALPGWAKLGAPRPMPPVAPAADIESTQVDARFDLESLVALEPASPAPGEVSLPRDPEPSVIELPPLEPIEPPAAAAPPIELPVAPMPAPSPPARAPIRPTPARPPPLPRSIASIPRAAPVPETTSAPVATSPVTPVSAASAATAASATTASRAARASSIPPPLPPAVRIPVRAAPVNEPRVRPPSGAALERPAERDELLVRLRQRGANLPRARVDEILTKRA